MSKYHSHKTTAYGLTFDSRKELARYQELQLLESAGAITDLQRQVKYILIPAQREPERIGARGGKIKGKLLEREVSYIADFVYHDLGNDEIVVEDVKGMRTKDYIIKRKLMLYVHGIRVKEV